jgi:hypothetical protein
MLIGRSADSGSSSASAAIRNLHQWWFPEIQVFYCSRCEANRFVPLERFQRSKRQSLTGSAKRTATQRF